VDGGVGVAGDEAISLDSGSSTGDAPVVGNTISVLWLRGKTGAIMRSEDTGDRDGGVEWYTGTVGDYDIDSNLHFIEYDDGDSAWHELDSNVYRIDPSEEVSGDAMGGEDDDTTSVSATTPTASEAAENPWSPMTDATGMGSPAAHTAMDRVTVGASVSMASLPSGMRVKHMQGVQFVKTPGAGGGSQGVVPASV